MAETKDNHPQKPHLRLVFVQLLFALTIGQLALKVGDVIIGRKDVIGHYLKDINENPFLYTHLLLCVFLITTSWIGWQSSKSSESPQLSGSVISHEYLILLLDIFLVICYFVIVRGTELSSSQATITGNKTSIDYAVQKPDSIVERFWMTVVFGTYLVWDFFTKVLVRSYSENRQTKKVKITYTFTPANKLTRSLTTLVCFLVSLFIYFKLDSSSKISTVNVDLMLIALIWAFRGWKQTIKPEFELKRHQVPQTNIDELGPHIDFPITVIESTRIFITKYFFARVLPIVLFFIFLFCYYN